MSACVRVPVKDTVSLCFWKDVPELSPWLSKSRHCETLNHVAHRSKIVKTKLLIHCLQWYKPSIRYQPAGFLISYSCFLLFSKFDHPHILKLLGVCLLNEPQYLILELMEGGDLLSYLRGARKKKVKTMRLIFLTCNCPEFLSFSLSKSPCWCSAVSVLVRSDLAFPYHPGTSLFSADLAISDAVKKIECH